jgi:phospholipid-binding lipoprotein MlaA
MPAYPSSTPASRHLTRASLFSVLALSACAGSSSPPAAGDAEATNDPYESTNRFFYGVDDKLVRYTIKPVSEGYVFVVPEPVRNGLHNVLTNLSSPVLFTNDVAEAKPRRAGDTFMRFIINSTAGGLGVFDVASGWGYPAHYTNFGITLGLWGVPSGPYLYLPLLGPSSPRAATGRAIDAAVDPFTYVPHGYGLLTLNWARYGLGLVDDYSRAMNDIDHVKAGALDPYATFRSLYRQHTQSQIDDIRNDTRATPPDWTPAPAP